ncbi:aspartate/glutamate racemase family protein [uncultured Oscillibacter sp.]|uniref:aspartate/glutamate racemase family protein n=1 Tax=uncultured Oscillibacter sp. TaxID=876091 RepID=UPI0025DF9F0B|nr:aspartate/glutamate racemase family protein [uncultured Oscillibacter sp.]
MNIAVIAGTPVDTRMGAGLLKKKGARALGFPVSQTPEEQTIFQTGPQTARERAVGAILDRIRAQGLERVLLYCNSLSATIDARALAEPRGLRIWTPMDVYGEIARTYRRVGVLAANCQGAAGVERAMVNASPEILVLGAANLALVQGVEAGTPPEILVEDCGLETLLRFFEQNGAEAVVLGCTHFPYVKAALQRRTDLPVLDPSERLAELVLGR